MFIARGPDPSKFVHRRLVFCYAAVLTHFVCFLLWYVVLSVLSIALQINTWGNRLELLIPHQEF